MYFILIHHFHLSVHIRLGDCVERRVIASTEIIKHELVPKHEVLGEEEKKAVLKKFDTSPEKLPKILQEDPVVVMIQAKTGDIIRIARDSHTAGESFYYRVVVNK